MTQIPVSRDKPPIFDALQKKFGISWETEIIAYDGKIHSKHDILPQKVVHEKIHLDRQKEIGNDAWWSLYLESDVFRFEEEYLAYKAEADFIKKNVKDREARFHMIRDIASSFSSSIYGNLISSSEAMKVLLKV